MNLPTAPWILVAEPDQAVQQTLVRYLGTLGFAVRAASSGSQALEILADRSRSSPSAIFVDSATADVNGHEFLHELRRRQPRLLQKSIWLAGGGDGDSTGLAAAWIPKPLWPKTISQALTKIGALVVTD
ncbi:MAG: response regulator [Verrucomicrobia bacterium]|nr:response regulator [Verrucomicrobiota bacterium]